MNLSKNLMSVAGILMIASSVHAETSTCNEIISVPSSIDQPGLYCLQTDLSGGPIIINADDVTLDMNNHTLSNYGNYGIRLMGDRVTVKNGSVITGVVGLESFGNQNLIDDMQVSNTTHAGIIVRGRDSIVRNNRLSNLDTYGIRCEGPSDWQARNQFTGNSINDFSGSAGLSYGISLSRCSISTIENNTLFSARRNDWFSAASILGIVMTHSQDALVVGNRMSHWYRGIWFGVSASGKYMNNLTTSVRFPFTGGTAVGDNN